MKMRKISFIKISVVRNKEKNDTSSLPLIAGQSGGVFFIRSKSEGIRLRDLSL